MIKLVSAVLLIVVCVGGYFWYSAQSLPSWYEEQNSQEEQVVQQLSEQIKNQGVAKFLGNKFADVMNGQVVFSEPEFNALLLASLKSDPDGRKLLAVSDAVNATLHEDHIELGAIINLDEVEKIAPKARKGVEKVNRLFPFLDNSRVAVSVFGNPVARGGDVGIKDDFHIKVGAIPISNSSLKQLGAPVERANVTNLAMKYLSVQSVTLQDGQITFSVLPRF